MGLQQDPLQANRYRTVPQVYVQNLFMVQWKSMKYIIQTLSNKDLQSFFGFYKIIFIFTVFYPAYIPYDGDIKMFCITGMQKLILKFNLKSVNLVHVQKKSTNSTLMLMKDVGMLTLCKKHNIWIPPPYMHKIMQQINVHHGKYERGLQMQEFLWHWWGLCL